MQGEMKAQRKELVRKAYNKVKSGDCASLDDFAKHYNPVNHPDVRNGVETAEGHYKHFLSLWEAKKPSDKITMLQFEDFYYAVSALIKDDYEFASLIQNEWRL